MIRVIGFSGRAGSGKSTAAAHLAQHHGFRRISFADPLREMLVGLGVRYSEMRGPEKELPHRMLNGHTIRHALQTLGTEWGRDIMGADFWMNIAKEKAIEALATDTPIVFDDVRFPNEVKLIRDLGGMVIHIIGGQSAPLQPGTHASETQELGRDWLINNNIKTNLLPGLLDAILLQEAA